MPNVKGKKFAYTPAGMKAAKAYAKKTGAKLAMYAMGGSTLKDAPAGKKGKGVKALPKAVRNKMGYKKYGGSTSAKPKMKYGGKKR